MLGRRRPLSSRTGTWSGNGAMAALEADRRQVVAEPIPKIPDSSWNLPSWGVRPREGDFLCSSATLRKHVESTREGQWPPVRLTLLTPLCTLGQHNLPDKTAQGRGQRPVLRSLYTEAPDWWSPGGGVRVPCWPGPGCPCGEEPSAHRGSHGAAVWGHAGAPGRGPAHLLALAGPDAPALTLGPTLPTRPHAAAGAGQPAAGGLRGPASQL